MRSPNKTDSLNLLQICHNDVVKKLLRPPGKICLFLGVVWLGLIFENDISLNWTDILTLFKIEIYCYLSS